MLGRMIIQGLVAAVVVASAAAVYAQGKDTPPPAETKAADRPAAKGDDGYLRPGAATFAPRWEEFKHGVKAKWQRDHHDRKHGRRCDDDD